MHWRSRKGKSGLIHMLMEKHGVSKRKAEKAVNAVFAVMTRSLSAGEPVEVPGGTIWIDGWPPTRKRRQFKRFRKIQDGKPSYWLGDYPQRMIRFRPDPALIEPPPKTKPESPGKIRRKRTSKAKSRPGPLPSARPLGPAEELVQLHWQLVGADLAVENLKLLRAVSQNDTNCLLDRLRLLAQRGRTYNNPKQLIAAVARLGRK